MEYILLGRTGVRVSRLALGTATFGVAPQEKDAIKLVHKALDLGINFFDTAVTTATSRGSIVRAHRQRTSGSRLKRSSVWRCRGTATTSSLPARCRSASSLALTAAALTGPA